MQTIDSAIEQRAASSLLDRGVRVKLPAPFFLKLFFIKNIRLTLRQPFLGTHLHAARLINAAAMNLDGVEDGDLTAVYNLIEKHGETMAHICAIFLLRRKWRIRLLAGALTKRLLWSLTNTKLTEIILLVMAFGGLEDFTSSIRLMLAFQQKMMAPRNLSHE